MSNVLLGCAIGDALGVPFETKPADYPPLIAWDRETFLGSEHHGLKPGFYSDDTQFSICVAQSLVDNNGFNPDDLVKRYVELFRSNTIRGFGKTTKLAIDNLIFGTHWSNSGIIGSYGNGTAMRAAPFGIYFRDDLKLLIECVKIDSNITHASDEATAGAITIALAAAYASLSETDDLIEKICKHLPNTKIKKTLLSLDSILNAQITASQALSVLGTKANVMETVPSAIYCFLKFNDFHNAVLAAICAGNDTDTTGSIVGALFGAKNGTRDVLKKWIAKIEDSEKLVLLDRSLFNRSNLYLFPR